MSAQEPVARAQRLAASGDWHDLKLVLSTRTATALAAGNVRRTFLVNQRSRICAVAQGADLPGDDDISMSPRMIAFIDVPPGTMFLPQAAELNDGSQNVLRTTHQGASAGRR